MNGFDDKEAASFGEALVENNTLEELDLSYNRINVGGCHGLGRGLAKNQGLRTLMVRLIRCF